MTSLLNAQRCLWTQCSIQRPARASQGPRTGPFHRIRAVFTDHWPELALQEVANQVEGVRCRQHVNPLKKELQELIPPQDWAQIFADPQRPLVVDIGCGPGRFLLALHQRFKGHNMLGLDIKGKLVERADSWAEGLGLQDSVHFMMANATVSLGSMLSSYPGPLTLVTVQFPDPHFKAKHKKRRVIQPQIVHALDRLMPPGGRVFLQSDIQDAATAMYQEFREHGSDAFCPDGSSVLLCEDSLLAAASTGLASSSASSRLQGHKDPRPDGLSTAEQPLDEQGSSQTGAADSSTSIACEEDTNTEVHHIESSESSSATSSAHDGWPPEIQWLPENPLGVPTEREVHSQRHGGSVYRALLVRC